MHVCALCTHSHITMWYHFIDVITIRFWIWLNHAQWPMNWSQMYQQTLCNHAMITSCTWRYATKYLHLQIDTMYRLSSIIIMHSQCNKVTLYHAAISNVICNQLVNIDSICCNNLTMQVNCKISMNNFLAIHVKAYCCTYCQGGEHQ